MEGCNSTTKLGARASDELELRNGECVKLGVILVPFIVAMKK